VAIHPLRARPLDGIGFAPTDRKFQIGNART
jgi:hypothetical protein